jgi:photosystem II stability/assembly factor-like uncharacterized protein
MLKFSHTALLLTALLITDARVYAQWQVVKRLPKQPTKTLNVDVPPSVEMRPPIVWSMSFTDDLNGWAACDDGTLLRTTDGGHSWARRTIRPRVNTLPPLFVDSIGTFFSSHRRGWVVAHLKSSAVILRTDDGGRSWKATFRAPFRRSSFHHIWFVDGKRGWAVGEAEDAGVHGGIIYGTKDGGRTWGLQYKGEGEESSVHEVTFSDASNGWAVGGKAVLRTSNGGATWQRQRMPEESYFFGVDVLSRDEAWVVGSGGRILHTLDGGASWSRSKLPPEYEDHWLNSVKFINTKQGWVAGNDGAIFFTEDGGGAWRLESKDTSSYLRGLTATGKFVFAFGNDGVILRRPS